MKKTFLGLTVYLGLLICAIPSVAQIEMGTPFGDGMVLQRGCEVPVWGRAEPGNVIMVRFRGKTVSSRVGPNGRWQVKLPPLKASKDPSMLSVQENIPGRSELGGVKIKDVLVGEVWLCSGQSNAELPIWGRSPRYRDGWGAMMLTSVDKPFVRMVKTPFAVSLEPRNDFSAKWIKMTPSLYDSFKKGEDLPSAVGYYYALELASALDIPIGLIDCSLGGTNIDAWTPRSGYAGLKGLDVEKNWKNVSEKDWKPEMRKGPINAWLQQPSVLWNGMVSAYAPMACRGMIWYQGCHNAGEPQRYCDKLHALYNGWSREFANDSLRFYFVQLAPWGRADIAQMQMAQAQFASEEKNSAMTIISDLGNLDDIHPNDKRTVAKRLSLHALRRDYGRSLVRDNSPTIRNWRVEGNRFVLSFNDAEGWYVYNPNRSTDVGFEVCGADGIWKPAKIVNLVYSKSADGKVSCNGSIEGRELMVASNDVRTPEKLRYLHSAPWFGSLYNDVCLPLGAFAIEVKK